MSIHPKLCRSLRVPVSTSTEESTYSIFLLWLGVKTVANFESKLKHGWVALTTAINYCSNNDAHKCGIIFVFNSDLVYSGLHDKFKEPLWMHTFE